MAGFEANRKDQFRRNPRRAFSSASSATKGYGCLYDLLNGTAADVNGLRHKNVIAPTFELGGFAGVHGRDLTRSQMTTIHEPGKSGSVAQCYLGAATSIGVRVYMDTNTGKFYEGGIGSGRGSGITLQTLTAAGLCDVLLDEGDTNRFVQILVPVTGALDVSSTGMTIIDGTSVTGGLTDTLADGVFIGQQKGYKVSVTLAGANDLVVTVTTGVQLDGATALATLTFNAADEQAILEWNGAAWQLMSVSGATIA